MITVLLYHLAEITSVYQNLPLSPQLVKCEYAFPTSLLDKKRYIGRNLYLPNLSVWESDTIAIMLEPLLLEQLNHERPILSKVLLRLITATIQRYE